jgi:type II secretory pathway pseudopilin PulG
MVLAWLCVFFAPLITIIYFVATSKYRCPKCKSTFLGVKNKEGVFVGQRSGVKSPVFIIIWIFIGIAIIGILSTIVMVSLNTARSKARDARRISDIRQLQLALQMYHDVRGVYPGALRDLTTPTAYIDAIPKDPQDEADYKYCAPAILGYHLGSAKMENYNTVLDSDADVIIDGCAVGSFSGQDGIGPYVYDVKS